MNDMNEKRGMGLMVAAGIWLAISLLMTLPRITHPAYGIQGDLALHYHISRSYARSFSEGDPLPRWAGLLDGGRGDAMFTFYPPFSYALNAVASAVFGLSVLNSLRLVTILTLFLAQMSAWMLAREFFDRRRSLIVSSLYVLLPAFPLIALHRGFFANGVAMGLAPLALLGARRLLTGEKVERGLIIFPSSVSAIVLTHSITTYLTGVAIGLMSIALWKRAGWRGLSRLAGASISALALTAFYLWPMVVERNWVKLGMQVVEQDFRNYFLFASASDATRYREAWANVNYITSLVILTQTLTSLLPALVAARPSVLFNGEDLCGRKLAHFGLLVALFGLMIALPVSEPLWWYLPGLKFIQFPWRFLPFVSLATGLMAVAAIDCRQGLKRPARLIISALLTWLFIFCAIFTFMFVRLNESGIARERVLELLDGRGVPNVTIDEGRRLQNEDDLKFVPYTANQVYFRPNGTAFMLYPPADLPGGLEVVEGKSGFIALINKIEHRKYRLDNETPVRLRLLTYAYPHWVARLDGREIPIAKEPESGLMLIEAPAGKHNLTLDFEIRDPGQRAARWISLLAWLGLAAWIVRVKLKPAG